jgi:P-type Ca2+ transporter type 2B
MTGSEFR